MHFCRAIVNKTVQPDALSTQCFEDFAVKKMSGWTWHLQRIFGENIFMLFAFSKTQTHTCTYMLSMAMI